MTKTVRLNDKQLVLLSHAAQNDAGALLPLPASLQCDEVQVTKELKSLLRRKLIEEREVAPGTESWRRDGDLCHGLFLTDKGREAIGVEGEDDADSTSPPLNDAPSAKASSHPRRGSKIAAVIALLQREDGATLDEMVEATGWLAHTTRAALTGLRKKGHTIAKSKRGDVTCYHIASER